MKKMFAMAFAISLFFACTNQKTEDKVVAINRFFCGDSSKTTAHRNSRCEVCGYW